MRKGARQKFAHAMRGIALVIISRDMLPHIIIAFIVIIAAVLLRVSRFEWCVLLICIGSVITAETLNTAMERLCDRVTREYDEVIRDVKDIAAGAVLIVSIISAVIGLIIFIPRIWSAFCA